MSKQEFLNFAEISKKIKFIDVLNWLNISYQQKNNELNGEGFIVSVEKNLFFVPGNDSVKGSVINFVAHYNEIDLREAAILLKTQFLTQQKVIAHKRDIPELALEYHSYLSERGIQPEIAKEYEVGYVHQRSIVSGRIAFKIYNNSNTGIGYVGYKPENKNWFFPKGFKRPLYNAHRLNNTKHVIVTVDPFDTLRIISLGIKQVASLLANSMTTDQEEELKKIKFILLFHHEPENIVNRLYHSSFIKAPVLFKPISEMSDTELMTLIKPL